ncbi:MAG: hypothetical protein HY321_16060 [Armatimonadetes bacterium]|nr:hypothetical protein [Armatimonadota bacterium]
MAIPGWSPTGRGSTSSETIGTSPPTSGRSARAGWPIADSDLLIAVCALQAGAMLVTNNAEHFEGLGVTVENWARE